MSFNAAKTFYKSLDTNVTTKWVSPTPHPIPKLSTVSSHKVHTLKYKFIEEIQPMKDCLWDSEEI